MRISGTIFLSTVILYILFTLFDKKGKYFVRDVCKPNQSVRNDSVSFILPIRKMKIGVNEDGKEKEANDKSQSEIINSQSVSKSYNAKMKLNNFVLE